MVRMMFSSLLLTIETMASLGYSAERHPSMSMRIPVEKFHLDNGLLVILSQDKTAPIVAVNLWYHVGSANERSGRTGFAHLFEHMLFQGSENVTANEHFELVQRAGG